MQDKQLYEYAVIRIVPRVEREEFVNVGVIVFCKRSKFLMAEWALDEKKVRCLATEFDTEQLRLNLDAFQRIANGASDGGPIALLEAPERFRWLTAVRSSVVQTSRPHPGYSDDLAVTLKRLMAELVY